MSFFLFYFPVVFMGEGKALLDVLNKYFIHEMENVAVGGCAGGDYILLCTTLYYMCDV